MQSPNGAAPSRRLGPPSCAPRPRDDGAAPSGLGRDDTELSPRAALRWPWAGVGLPRWGVGFGAASRLVPKRATSERMSEDQWLAGPRLRVTMGS
jgi:hypothetical protein